MPTTMPHNPGPQYPTMILLEVERHIHRDHCPVDQELFQGLDHMYLVGRIGHIVKVQDWETTSGMQTIWTTFQNPMGNRIITKEGLCPEMELACRWGGNLGIGIAF